MSKNIIRTEKNRENPYVMIDKRIFEYGLTPKTVGILAYLLSKPDNWITNAKQLQRHFAVGRTAIETSLNELEEKGFLVREQLRDESGKFGSAVYIIYEVPQHTKITQDTITEDFSPNVEKQHTANVVPKEENPHTDKPRTDNQQHNNKRSIPIKEYTNLSPNEYEQAATLEKEPIPQSNETKSNELDERELSTDRLIAFWNEQGVNVHTRLGHATRRRIEKALAEALEDFTQDELLSTIVIYSRLYKRGKCDHKYRLVEFMEKRGYEHFTTEENWTSRDNSRPFSSADFSYGTLPNPDKNLFPFLSNDESDDSNTKKNGI